MDDFDPNKNYNEKELDVLLLLPQPKKYEEIDKFVKIEPPTPPILKYDSEIVYMKKFWENYADELSNYESNECNKCVRVFTKNRDCHRHVMAHFDSGEYTKFDCSRCMKNYSTYEALKKHHSRGMCYLSSEFPKQTQFVVMCLRENPQQEPSSKICSNCNEFTDIRQSKVHIHFLSCVKFPYSCPKCSTLFTTYKIARIHFENYCDGNFRYFRYYYEKITPPNVDEKEKEWTEDEMLELIKTNSAGQMKTLLSERLPPNACLSVGQSENLRSRDNHYNNYAITIRRAELEPYMTLNEMVTFRTWRRYYALLYEYLLQRETNDPDGELYAEFGNKMNPQKCERPKKTEENFKADRPYFVYIKATRKKWSWADAKKFYNDDEESKQQDATVKARAGPLAAYKITSATVSRALEAIKTTSSLSSLPTQITPAKSYAANTRVSAEMVAKAKAAKATTSASSSKTSTEIASTSKSSASSSKTSTEIASTSKSSASSSKSRTTIASTSKHSSDSDDDDYIIPIKKKRVISILDSSDSE
ncbi:hypothetical protein PVAND_002191 [Polypedilum vanderplanki]|uniref:C2H2-type domain-containing protein n=1 Tax=Polypedilum vanderplanki TaxID=319348 RepID=A0A9J6BQU3_POLVA|nr:hypothetical protein PVAND_002191 [Polypedilum vanderplanki]